MESISKMMYNIIKAEHGYIISCSNMNDRGLLSKQWAFSTIKEVQEHLPFLFDDGVNKLRKK